MMEDDVAAYIDGIDADHRPLFGRVHCLVMEVQPDAHVVLSYKMPTYVAGTRELHVGVWKHGLSFYGWEHGKDGGLVARHPHLDSGKGTLRLPLTEAVHISDDELRTFWLLHSPSEPSRLRVAAIRPPAAPVHATETSSSDGFCRSSGRLGFGSGWRVSTPLI